MSGLEGRDLGKIVALGSQLTERQLGALKGNSPTAEQILSGLGISGPPPEPPSKSAASEEKVNTLPEVQLPQNYKRRTRSRRTPPEGSPAVSQVIVEDDSLKAVEKPVTRLEQLIKSKEDNELSNPENSEADFMASLEAMSQEADNRSEPEPAPVEVSQPVVDDGSMRNQILDALKDEENAPTEQDIESWKQRFGKSGVYVMAFGEGNIFVYHHLTRNQWKKIREIMDKIQQGNEKDIEELLKEKVIQFCTLWPQLPPNYFEICKAGIVDSLYQVILINSGFLNTQQAMLLTTQL